MHTSLSSPDFARTTRFRRFGFAAGGLLLLSAGLVGAWNPTSAESPDRAPGPAMLDTARAPGAQRRSSGVPEFSIVEASIGEMQRAMREGRVTSRRLVELHLQRIATYEDRLNAVMHINPRALDEADALDRERATGNVRGPLHGVPVAVKDNIHTTNLPTTGGALAFAGLVPPYEATLVTHLKNAGAIILAKTVLTELANWVAGDPTPMPANYNALAGYGLNPYDPRRDPRPGTSDGRPVLSPGGSSSGIGTAASFWAANVGTETSGSILSPSNQNMLVGIKPTVGRVSRYGVIPITADQDTPGPMARSVADAALLLSVIEGRGADTHDPATGRCAPAVRGYEGHLDRRALKGARIGVPRAFYYDEVTVPGGAKRGGLTGEQAKAMEDAIQVLEREGAIVVSPANIPSVVDERRDHNLLLWNTCSGTGRDEDCSIVFKYGMKRDFNAWLASLGAAAPVKSLTDLRAFNRDHRAAGAIKYGQSLLDISDEMDLVRDRVRYEADRARDLALSGAEGIDQALRTHRLDALLFPGGSGASLAAKPGYPTIIVPFAMVATSSVSFPDGFVPKPAPYGVSFTGAACSEPRLIELAYAFEQATKRRRAPALEVD